MARLLLGALALLVAVAGARPAEAVELPGTWHVLIHYKDATAAHPEQERWQDRVWVFEREGSRLRWTDYPIVVFSDSTGRFEKLGTNRASRVLGYWEPNAAQLAQIHEGLEINSRGSRSKALRGSDAEGWSSGKKSRYQSARFITFEEVWQITGMPDRPTFTRDEQLGSMATESMRGRTVWAAESVDSTGDVIRGHYDRDGTRIGTFRMMRSGAVRPVEGSGSSQGERASVALLRSMGSQLFEGDLPGGLSEVEVRGAIDAGEFGEGDREALRAAFERHITEFFQGQGNDPRVLRPQIKSLSEKLVALFVDQGKSIREIRQMLIDGRLEL
jgi:hypothetical protein